MCTGDAAPEQNFGLVYPHGEVLCFINSQSAGDFPCFINYAYYVNNFRTVKMRSEERKRKKESERKKKKRKKD